METRHIGGRPPETDPIHSELLALVSDETVTLAELDRVAVSPEQAPAAEAILDEAGWSVIPAHGGEHPLDVTAKKIFQSTSRLRSIPLSTEQTAYRYEDDDDKKSLNIFGQLKTIFGEEVHLISTDRGYHLEMRVPKESETPSVFTLGDLRRAVIADQILAENDYYRDEPLEQVA